jgi:hypothetical protein
MKCGRRGLYGRALLSPIRRIQGAALELVVTEPDLHNGFNRRNASGGVWSSGISSERS